MFDPMETIPNKANQQLIIRVSRCSILELMESDVEQFFIFISLNSWSIGLGG